jgi:hypothetical protein
VFAGLAELRVLGKKAVAGMNRVGAGAPRSIDDALDVEVSARIVAQRDGFVRMPQV